MPYGRTAGADDFPGIECPEHHQVLTKVDHRLQVPEGGDAEEDGPLALVQGVDLQGP